MERRRGWPQPYVGASVPKSHLVQSTAFVLSCVEVATMLASQDWQILLMGQHQHWDRSSLCIQSYYFSLSKMVLIFQTVQPFSLSLPITWKANFSSSSFIIYSVSCNVASSVYYLQCRLQFSFWNFSSFHHITLLFHSMLFIIQYFVYLSLAFTFL